MAEHTHPVAVTIGDPAGIGPEIVLKAVRRARQELGDLIIVGSRTVLEQEAARLSRPGENITETLAGLTIADVPLPAGNFKMGEISADCGAGAYRYLEKAVALAKEGRAQAIVTAPIHKESWKAAKVPHVGHTEALSEMLGKEGETLFVVGQLRIFFLTRHVSLAKAITLISADRVLALLRHANEAMSWLGIKTPRIAVAALNPHASDGGLFGTEEAEHLLPAVEAARREGINAFGPLPGDSVFHQCAQGEFDAVISLYHDQGHIASKMKSFLGTVSVTTGLPVLRTSVDHGTAFDIAGKGKADPTSMIEAIKVARQILDARGQ